MSKTGETENVELIRGDPKKAINKLAIPMILSMLLMSANNIIDSIWVAGLGSDPLAALGYITPLFLILVGIGTGIGAGANSLISRLIGRELDDQANNASIHSLIISVVITILLTVILLISLKGLLIAMGGEDVLSYGMSYGTIIMLGTFTFILPAVFGSLMRSEGDMKRATFPLVLTAVLNMILDPIFIYVLNLGISGAALATVFSGFIAVLLFIYWLFIKKDTFLKIDKKYFKRDMSMYKEILLVGIPASVEQLIMSLTSIIINSMLTIVAGTSAVAVYTAGWRLVQIGIMPTIGIGTAAITVAGVAYGQRNYHKLNTVINYSTKVGLLIGILVAVIFFIFSNQLAYLFSYSDTSANLSPLISQFIQIMCLYIIPVPLGMIAGSVLQAFGKGTQSLLLTTNRSLILDVIFAGILALIFSLGAVGVYWGIVIGDILGSIVAFVYIKWYVKKLNTLGVFDKN